MQIFELQGELRTDLGKKATNLLRAEGKYLVFFMVVKKMYIFQWLKKICKNCFTLRLYTS